VEDVDIGIVDHAYDRAFVDHEGKGDADGGEGVHKVRRTMCSIVCWYPCRWGVGKEGIGITYPSIGSQAKVGSEESGTAGSYVSSPRKLMVATRKRISAMKAQTS
jgi:hypothetical protein